MLTKNKRKLPQTDQLCRTGIAATIRDKSWIHRRTIASRSLNPPWKTCHGNQTRRYDKTNLEQSKPSSFIQLEPKRLPNRYTYIYIYENIYIYIWSRTTTPPYTDPPPRLEFPRVGGSALHINIHIYIYILIRCCQTSWAQKPLIGLTPSSSPSSPLSRAFKKQWF